MCEINDVNQLSSGAEEQKYESTLGCGSCIYKK